MSSLRPHSHSRNNINEYVAQEAPLNACIRTYTVGAGALRPLKASAVIKCLRPAETKSTAVSLKGVKVNVRRY